MMNAWERQAIRDAVKEASERSKTARERRSIGKAFVAGDPEAEDMHRRIVDDTADLFVDVLTQALRRAGAWIVFLE